jgi:RNA polymerase sigma-70 factor (ECF subfamily)
VPLRAFVALRLPVNHLVDEITHEAFVFAFTHLADFEPDGSFRAWLRTIAHNLVRRELLRFAREKQNLSKFEQLQIADLSERHEQDPGDEVVFLEECLGLLPENLRRLLDDRYKHGHSGAEIAKSWGRTEEWVRVTLLRVRRQLRACIDGKMTGAPHAS